jgi:5-methylcytosine-specific restriction endonuclease McrA
MRRLADAYWYNLKDKARIRGGGKCEYCGLRAIRALHHRSYVREGAERIEDVMVVCWTCHRVIHGRHTKREFTVAAGSLADQGDNGFDYSKLWRSYLTRKH